MAEIFTNYISTITGTGSKIIVPKSGTNIKVKNNNQNSADQFRDATSIAQVHSIYICQKTGSRLTDDNRYKESNFSIIDIYVKNSKGDIVYVAYDVQIVPGSPYYIEKNITLTDSQWLEINVYQNPNGSSIDINASTVLFTEDND